MPSPTNEIVQEQGIDVYKKTWSRRIEAGKHRLQEKKEILLSLARKCAEILKKEFGLTEIYLIGSLSRPFPINEHTDIDIVVRGLPDIVYFRALKKLYEILPAGVELDLITIESALPGILCCVEEEGLKL